MSYIILVAIIRMVSKWTLSDKFALEVIHSKNVGEPTSNRANNHIHWFLYSTPSKGIRIEHFESKQTDSLPLVFECEELNEAFTVQLYLVKFTIVFSQKTVPQGQTKAIWVPHTHHPILFALTVSDIIRIYYYINKGKPDTQDKTKEKTKVIPDSQYNKYKDFQSKKKAMFDRAFRTDSVNDRLNILGYLSRGQLHKSAVISEYQKSGLDLDKFLGSKILFYSTGAKGNEETVMRSINREHLGQSIMNLASNDLVDLFVQYFYWGKSLGTDDDTISFETPITMREFIALIDDDCGTHQHKTGLKEWLTSIVFKDCNSHEAEVLSKHAEGAVIIDNDLQFPDNIPPSVFRTFHFSKFSKSLVLSLVSNVRRAIRANKVPKKWKNPADRDRYVTEDWINEKGSSYRHEWDRMGDHEMMRETDKYTKNLIKLGLAGDIPDNSDQESQLHNPNDLEDKYVYDLPAVLDDPTLLEESHLDFLTDDEIHLKCQDIDTDPVSFLSDKVNQLNLLAYSRVAGNSEKNYQLLLPGTQFKLPTEFSVYEEFFKPIKDLRLPTICIYSTFHSETNVTVTH